MIASLLSVARNDKLKICNDNFNYIHAFSYALKNQFEIISRNENYAFNHNNFYHNGNNQSLSLRGFSRSNPICRDCFATARNDDSVDCHARQLARTLCAPFGDDGKRKSRDDEFNGLFSRNDYGKDFIFGFWSNFNFGFLFNRKINSKKILFQKEKKR